MIKNLALLVVSGLVALLLGEIACRVFYSPVDREMSTFKAIKNSAYLDDSEVGWVPKPSFQGEHRLPHNQISTFSTNSLGLRDREVALEKRAGVQRIVVAGDSFAWGWGVNDGEDFADQLMTGRSDREVVNLGVINYNVLQERKYFERMGAQFQPDIVLLAFCENDVVGANYDFLATHAARLPMSGEEESGLRRFKRAIAEHSMMYRLANDVVMSQRGMMRLAVALGIKDGLDGYDDLDYNLRPFLKEYPVELAEQWSAAMAQVLEFKAVADAGRIRFIVAVIPALQSVDRNALEASLATSKYGVDDFDLNRPYAALADFARQNGMEMIDPTPAFREVESRGENLYLTGDLHFNRDGHRLFAKVISEYLEQAAQS